MTWGGRYGRIAAAGAVLIACCLVTSLWIAGCAPDDAAPRHVSAVLIQPRQVRSEAAAGSRTAATRSVRMTLTACEARIEGQPRRRPTVAIVGASYTAGTGPDNPSLSWAVLLARQLSWNAVVYGDPGAGYVRVGAGGRGPMEQMLGAEQLRGLNPALVLVQAGFDDIGVPAGLERQQVADTVDLIRAAAPRAAIGLLTTFGYTTGGSPALRQTDQAIIAAGKAADPRAIIMDPLGGQWTFPRARFGGLHPSAAGDAWIARTVAAILRARGVRPAPAAPAAPVICDAAVGVGRGSPGKAARAGPASAPL